MNDDDTALTTSSTPTAPRHQLSKAENSRGGRIAHLRGTGREWSKEEAAAAGRKSAAQRCVAVEVPTNGAES
jgi:hypothetical protein